MNLMEEVTSFLEDWIYRMLGSSWKKEFIKIPSVGYL